MKRKLLLCMGAMLLAGTLAAQVPVPEWETGVEQIKSLIKTDPGQASATAGELLKGKNKKNVSLIISIARAYLNRLAGDKGDDDLDYLKAEKDELSPCAEGVYIIFKLRRVGKLSEKVNAQPGEPRRQNNKNNGRKNGGGALCPKLFGRNFRFLCL